MLDGDLVVGAGRLSVFHRLSGRLAGKPRPGSEAVVFVAFALLWIDGEQLTTRPYRDRRAHLEGLELAPALVVPSYDVAAADDFLAGWSTDPWATPEDDGVASRPALGSPAWNGQRRRPGRRPR